MQKICWIIFHQEFYVFENYNYLIKKKIPEIHPMHFLYLKKFQKDLQKIKLKGQNELQNATNYIIIGRTQKVRIKTIFFYMLFMLSNYMSSRF
jgi:hypothetical protein